MLPPLFSTKPLPKSTYTFVALSLSAKEIVPVLSLVVRVKTGAEGMILVSEVLTSRPGKSGCVMTQEVVLPISSASKVAIPPLHSGETPPLQVYNELASTYSAERSMGCPIPMGFVRAIMPLS